MKKERWDKITTKEFCDGCKLLSKLSASNQFFFIWPVLYLHPGSSTSITVVFQFLFYDFYCSPSQAIRSECHSCFLLGRQFFKEYQKVADRWK